MYHTPGYAPGHVAFCSNQGFIWDGGLLLEHIRINALIDFDLGTQEATKACCNIANVGSGRLGNRRREDSRVEILNDEFGITISELFLGNLTIVFRYKQDTYNP